MILSGYIQRTMTTTNKSMTLANGTIRYVRVSADSVPPGLNWSADFRGVTGPATAREMATASDGTIYMRQFQANNEYGYAMQVES